MTSFKVCVDNFEAKEPLGPGAQQLIKEEGDYTLVDVVEYALEEAYEHEEECV